jgi:lipopolysaccharide/colanic/teichoic acid biosynthesis glycosyltransferase
MALLSTGCLGLAIRFVQNQYNAAKPYVDWVAALVLLVVTGPLILLCAALVKLTSRGPAFYLQERVGQRGRIFRLIKLRTMYADAEADTGPVWSPGRDDPRITPVGRLLRRLHLDELPQLVNVLRGEMSLVGPRPERPTFVNTLREEVTDYERRLSVKPGITGLAQIRAGYDRTIRDVRRKVRLDCLYIRRMCLWVDMLIIAGTVRALFLGSQERRDAGKETGGLEGHAWYSAPSRSSTSVAQGRKEA